MKHLILVIFIFFTFTVLGQINSIPPSGSDRDTLVIEKFDPSEIESYLTQKKLRFNVELGTTFATSPGNGSFFGTYVAPQVNYRLTKRFSINAGGYFMSSPFKTYYNPMEPGTSNYYFSALSRSYVFVEGAYQLNPNLILRGAAIKEVQMFRNPTTNYAGSQSDYSGMILGVDYKLGENVFIHGQVEFSNGRNPTHFSPHYHPGHPSSKSLFHDSDAIW